LVRDVPKTLHLQATTLARLAFMNVIKSSSVAARLSVGFAALLGLLLLATAAGLHGLRSVHSAAQTALSSDVLRAQAVADIRILILTARRFEKDSFINLDAPEKHAGYKKKWQANQTALTQRIEAAQGMTLSEEDSAALKLIASSAQEYGKGFDTTLAQIAGGVIGTAEDANRSFEKFKQSVHTMESTSAAMNERAIKAVQAISKPLETQYQRTALVQAALAAVSLVVAGVLGWLISRSITRQLGGEPSYATEVVQRIAHGDLSHSVKSSDARHGTQQPANQRSLLFAVDQMQTQLVEMVNNIRNSSSSIASASNQIASGNADLVQRGDQQGANLQQTAASMEELSTTVKRNADTALHASELARGASAQASEGGELVGRAVLAMQEISQSAKKISEITSVIDSIAFQTNILALNAAVEAARAGEQGRGFAVVASEVRTLAQRAASASKEIKLLIDTSVEQVASGSAHVQNAGNTMTRIVESVHTVAELIAEISRATQEQNVGITQVSSTMVELDRATQQNNAVVEQSSSASTSLRQEAEKLVSLVSLFKLQANVESEGNGAPAIQSPRLALA
jgi:methyl-accepting chemotaxis protein